MYLKNIKVFNFRNLENAEIEFSSSLNLIAGKNGQGKTNLLEAISVLARTRSFRTSRLKEAIKWGEKQASVFGMVANRLSQTELGFVFGEGKKEAYVDGSKKNSISEYLGNLVIVSFSPYDLEIIKGGPSKRRKFLDLHVVNSGKAALGTFRSYGKALKNKNLILKQERVKKDQLMSWNAVLSEYAEKIILARHNLIENLNERANEYMNRLSRNKESIKLELVSNAVNDPKAPNKKEILDKMQSYQDREIKNRISIIGPHRDDIIIWLNDKPSREYASQGQARTIILSLKLALLDLLADYLGEAPLVLLDDLDSELDSIRREQLYKTVTDHRCQIFITGTEFEGKKEPGAESKQFAVEDGRVLSMEKIVGKSRVGGQTGPRSNTF